MKRFGSASEAAKWGEVSEHTVRDSGKRRLLGQGRYMWRREHEWGGSETFNPRAHGKPVVVMGRGHLCWFPTLTDAASALEVPSNTVAEGIRLKARVRGEWQVAYLTSTEDWPKLKEKFDVRRKR